MKIRGKNLAAMVSCVTVLAATVMVGCIVVPIKMKTRVEGPAGTKQTLPKEALAPGTTTRQQVEEMYKGFAVETDIPNFLWGRFRKSSWAVIFAAGGGYGGAVAGGGRTWEVHNLLITFDSNGIVKSVESVPDKQLQKHLMTAAKELGAPPLDLSDPINTGGTLPQERALDLELTERALTARLHVPWYNKKKPEPPPKVVVVPVEQIESVVVGKWYDDKSTELGVTLHFDQKTKLGKSITFSAGPNEGLTLLRWLEQVRPSKPAPETPQK